MKKLEKKQIPQFAALCVLSAGLFGYFVVRLVTPTPAAAGTRPAQTLPPAAKQAPAGTAKPATNAPLKDPKAALTPGTLPAEEDATVPVPTAGMHDPFVVGYVDPATILTAHGTPALPSPLGKPAEQMASLPQTAPAFMSAPALPAPLNLKGFPVQPLPSAPHLPAAPAVPAAVVPMAAAPAPPTWTVTGVLQSDGQQVAILRSGPARRIVHTGDFVDSMYRVVSVTRSSVVLRHGAARYPLVLGVVKDAPAKNTSAKSAFDSEKSVPPALPTAFTAIPASLPSLAQMQKGADTAAEAGTPNNFNF